MAAAALNAGVGSSNSGPSAASSAVLQAAAGMYEQLKGEWNRKSPNLSKCGEELGRLKVGVAGGAEPSFRTRGSPDHVGDHTEGRIRDSPSADLEG